MQALAGAGGQWKSDPVVAQAEGRSCHGESEVSILALRNSQQLNAPLVSLFCVPWSGKGDIGLPGQGPGGQELIPGKWWEWDPT